MLRRAYQFISIFSQSLPAVIPVCCITVTMCLVLDTKCKLQSLQSRVTHWLTMYTHIYVHALCKATQQDVVMQSAANLSAEQLGDLLHLRRMCIIKRGQLAEQRKAKLSQLPFEGFSSNQTPFPADDVIELFSLGSFIRDYCSEDFKIWSTTRCSCLRGVSHVNKLPIARHLSWAASLSVAVSAHSLAVNCLRGLRTPLTQERLNCHPADMTRQPVPI